MIWRTTNNQFNFTWKKKDVTSPATNMGSYSQPLATGHLEVSKNGGTPKSSNHLLVGGWATPLKNMSSSIGMISNPILMGK